MTPEQEQKLDAVLSAVRSLTDAVLALGANAETDRQRLFTAHDELGSRVTRLERVIKPKPVKRASRG